jgi:DNA-binding LacI/PurR family transcriptional regulator
MARKPPAPGTARRATVRRATITDVARAAGVSTSTASLAFSGAGPVSPATRARVLAAAGDLDYAGPDPTARSLRRGRSGVVAAVVGARLGHAFRDPMMVAMLDGLAEQVGAMGNSLLLVPVRSSIETEAATLTTLAMDAAVLLDCEVPTGGLIGALRRRGTVVVGVDGPDGVDVPQVRIDDEGGTAALVGYLAELGHHDLGVITLPLGMDGTGGPLTDADLAGCRVRSAPGVPQRRLRAARAEAAARPGMRTRFVEAAWNLVEDGERAAGLLLDAARPPTAMIAQSDVLALGCLRAASARGLAVPADLSVAGFDGVDLHLLGGTLLTTIEQPATEKGRAAGRMVATALNGGTPDDVELPIALRVGTTTGPQASRTIA